MVRLRLRRLPGVPPEVVLTAEGAAAFAATGLVTVTPTTTPGVFTLTATEEDRCRDRRCSHGEGGTENADQLCRRPS